jgi:Nucleotidyltransferase of unknown function (DUF6036)
MNRSEMLKNLHKLDKKLWMKLDIEICGASAAILKNALARSSGDIDVINSSFPLNDPKMRNILDEIEKSPNERESWLNQNAREDILRRFPKSYIFDTDTIEGESFKNLHPTIISKADFVICKLSIEEEKRRLHDIPDVKNLMLDKSDAKRIFDKLNMLSIDKQPLALKIEGLFKQIRPEFVLNNDQLPYSNGQEIGDYVLKRYGVKIKNLNVEHWNEDIIGMIKKPSTIIGEIDYKAGEAIESGNALFAAKDREYRVKLKKELDYGMDL